MEVGKLKIDMPLYFAPLAGISTIGLRTLMRELGCGVTTTELVSCEAMIRTNPRTKRMIRLSDVERPAGVQIFGHDPVAMAETARMIEANGADFVDINLGCPVRKIVKQGAGAALLQDEDALGAILEAVRKAITIPLTIKIRTGFYSDKLTYEKVIALAYNCGVQAVAIHGRSREQGFEGEADWDVIRDAKAKSPLPIIGNGDLTHYQKAIDCWQQSGCDGIMIGRGALRNPWIFLEIRAALAGGNPELIERDSVAVVQRLAELLQLYEEPRFQLLQLKKAIAWFCTGMRDSSRFRAELFKLGDFAAVIDLGVAFFAKQRWQGGIQERERFLMAGHG